MAGVRLPCENKMSRKLREAVSGYDVTATKK